MEKRYILQCLFENIKDQHMGLVKEIANTYDVTRTLTRGFAAHTTLKDGFFTDNIEEIDTFIEDFCENHEKTPVKIKEIDCFNYKGIYVPFAHIHFPEQTRETFSELILGLKGINWMNTERNWAKYDSPQRTHHLTFAEGCTEEENKGIVAYLESKNIDFDCLFDNIVVLERLDEKEFNDGRITGKDTYNTYRIHKIHRMK